MHAYYIYIPDSTPIRDSLSIPALTLNFSELNTVGWVLKLHMYCI